MLVTPDRRTNCLSSVNGAKGFSLLEVMISLVVFSIGLLGMSNLQLIAKAANYDSVQRTSASLIGFNLLERMRANSGGLANYLGNIGAASAAVPATDCETVSCAPDEIATFDLWDSERLLDGVRVTRDGKNTGGLVDPTVCISGPSDGSSGIYVVTVAWRGAREHKDKLNTTCGNGKYGADNAYRRALTYQTFISTS